MAGLSFSQQGATPANLPSPKPFDSGLFTPKPLAQGLFTPKPLLSSSGSSKNFSNPFDGGLRGGSYQNNPQQQVQHGTPSTPVKSVTTGNDGTVTSTYHAPVQGNNPGMITNSSSTQPTQTSASTSTNQPPPQVGNQMQNAQNVLNQSNLNNNPEYQNLNQQQNALVQGQQSGLISQYSDKGGNLGNTFADINRPQSTGNLAGELGSFNAQTGIQLAGNAAERQGLIAGGQLATQGANDVLTAGQPGQISPGNTAYNPLTGENISGIGANPFQGGVAQGNVALGQQYAQMNAAHEAASGIKNTISSYLTNNPNLNPSEFTDVNKMVQFLGGKTSNSQYQTLSNYLTEYVSTLAPILGVGGDTTNLKTDIAQQMVNAHASGQSINTVLDNLDKLAQTKLDAIKNAGQGGTQSSTGGSSNTVTGQPIINSSVGKIDPNF